MMKAIWLFRFTSYSYCQGTRDRFYNDMRLLTFTLPCDKDEAEHRLANHLQTHGIEYDETSIESLNINIINS